MLCGCSEPQIERPVAVRQFVSGDDTVGAKINSILKAAIIYHAAEFEVSRVWAESETMDREDLVLIDELLTHEITVDHVAHEFQIDAGDFLIETSRRRCSLNGIEADGLSIGYFPDLDSPAAIPDDVMLIQLSSPAVTRDDEAFVVTFASHGGSGGPSLLHLVPTESQWTVAGQMILAIQ